MTTRALVLGLVACTSTRQLAGPVDPRLQTPDHGAGFVVRTTERWHERIDPNTTIRFHSAHDGWSDRLQGRDLYVDGAGVWIDRQAVLSELADAVWIGGLSPDAAAELEATRPADGRLDRDGDGWILSAPRLMLRPWLSKLELAIADLDPAGASVFVCDAPCETSRPRRLVGDDARLYNLRIVHSGEPLGTWRVYSRRQGWLPPVHGVALIELLDGGRATKAGWRWDRVDAVEVENISGSKTLGAIVGTVALSIALLPAALVLNGLGSSGIGHGSSGARAGNAAGHALGGGGGGGPAKPGDWMPEIADRTSLDARRLFSTGSRVRSIMRGTVSIDGAAVTRRDLIASGMIGRLRFADIFEIGGGVRLVEARSTMGWSHSTTGVFQVGFHLPLDAGFRIAVPLGFEASSGGVIAHDLRFPWGLRYTSASGRWFGTLQPATPAHVRLDGEPHGRWSIAVGSEVGLSF